MTDKEKFKLMEVMPQKKGVYIVSLFELNGEFEGKHNIRLEFDGENWDYGMRKSQYVGFINKRVG